MFTFTLIHGACEETSSGSVGHQYCTYYSVVVAYTCICSRPPEYILVSGSVDPPFPSL